MKYNNRKLLSLKTSNKKSLQHFNRMNLERYPYLANNNFNNYEFYSDD
jgi:hypothetical protein